MAETGGDMSRFATPQRLASWAGLCPGNNESAGEHFSGRTRKGKRGLRGALGEAAAAASGSKNTYLSTVSTFVRPSWRQARDGRRRSRHPAGRVVHPRARGGLSRPGRRLFRCPRHGPSAQGHSAGAATAGPRLSGHLGACRLSYFRVNRSDFSWCDASLCVKNRLARFLLSCEWVRGVHALAALFGVIAAVRVR
jgi:hypothetical protein